MMRGGAQEKEEALRANLKREGKKLKLRARENARLQRQVLNSKPNAVTLTPNP
jgi:hypothetical protein